MVLQWEKEHQKIVTLAHEVIEAYEVDNVKDVRLALKELSSKTNAHLMHEDLEFFDMLQTHEHMDEEAKEKIEEFKKTFSGVKVTLMRFLRNYADDDSIIDEKFFKQFSDMVAVLAQRIDFEENNIYTVLSQK